MQIIQTSKAIDQNLWTPIQNATRRCRDYLLNLCRRIMALLPFPHLRKSMNEAIVHPATKAMFSKLNQHFPNVVVVGGYETTDGQETLRQLDHLGIKYWTRGPYDGSKLPIEVWSRLKSEEKNEKVRESLIKKVKAQEPLTTSEKASLKKLKGCSACYMLHRDVILQTIKQYRAAIAEEQAALQLSDGPEKESTLAEAQEKVKKYSSIFILEHNSRFGYVDESGKAELTPQVKEDFEKAVKALPADWEIFSLFNWDLFPEHAKKPHDLDDALVYPSVSMGTKAIAISCRLYDDLEKIFAQVTESSASIDFLPIDLQIHNLAREVCTKDPEHRRFQLAPRKSIVYRAAGASFHANQHNPACYAAINFPGVNYSDSQAKEKVNRTALPNVWKA